MNQQNNMNLILQAPKQHAVPSSAIESIAALAGGRAERIADDRVPDADAWRVAGVSQSDALKASIDAACLQARLDYAFIEEGRKLSDFRLVAMDMDSTLITIECIDEIADMQGLKPQVAEITEAAMRGEIEFNESLTRRVALLKGLEAGALQRVYDERLQLSLGAENMLKAVQAAGLKTLLVSGGFTFFTDRMKARLNLDYTHANTLEVADGKLTGKVVGGIVNADEKRATVERICREIGAEPSQAIVMGDGANDLRMMGISGLSVAFRAKPVVRAQASVGLNFVGLDGILNLLA
ncbi:phosphoserine phosphatase SerB [Herbaspirillum sp.]|jgi:phosphoserine phosphatase|uniref:phosphoserine phosphatase SerB n=1 Tax=Herbaspirillum TaxID=963 RepID=UPI00258AB52C|nr:phosphoserine phosphatase SerB [Herbaspirillum sp.]MCP3656559.1 phosphoserine phosphatase SerB [Herbaspirillum sp.]MCP3949383.1 phosphoserine phosphatase SerB [Herbaspirillum sp.]MCP4030390.1 phosphoserine phosphatase SerB [Herbaspirillum sp.]MCP4556875.1 phosphoserine phosphatase SerB [Herbaspirillum sp.]